MRHSINLNYNALTLYMLAIPQDPGLAQKGSTACVDQREKGML